MKQIFLKHILFLSFICFVFNAHSQSKIDESKDELKKGDTHKSSTDNHHKDHGSNNRSELLESDRSIGSIILGGILQGIYYVSYYTLIGDYENEYHLHSPLTKFPYYKDRLGNYEKPDSFNHRKNPVRIDVEEKFLFNNQNLFGNHIKARVHPFQYFSFQGDYSQLTEYNHYANGYSNLPLFSFNLCYDRIRLDFMNLGWSLGVKYVGSDVKRAGFLYGLNADAFIFKNVSIYSSVNWSSINHQPVNEFEINAKYHCKRYYFTLGYDYLKLANPTYKFLSIGGGVYF